MHKQFISVRQSIAILVMFIMGSSLVMGVNMDAEQDSWLALIFAVGMALPVFAVYARIMHLFPEKNIFDVCEIVFGKIAGKILIVIFVFYSIHLGALVMRNFSEFIKIASLPETPELPLMILMMLVTVYLTKSGAEILGKWAVIMLPFVALIIFFTIILALNAAKPSNLLPVLSHSAPEMAGASFGLFSFPFAEAVVFLGMANFVKQDDSPYKIYFSCLVLSAIFTLSVVLRNIALLGQFALDSYFPSYMAARIISIGNFLSRIEGSISFNFVLCGITKISVCLFSASNGMAKLFQVKNYKTLLFPVALTVFCLCAMIYSDVIEMFEFIGIYKYYAAPFQILLPLLVWIGAEIKAHKQKKGSPAAKAAA